MGFIDELINQTDLKVNYNELMKKHTSYCVGGYAKFFAEAENLSSLNNAMKICKKYKIPLKIIGNGTNLLVSDKGYNGLVISTKKINEIISKGNEIKAMCGANLNKVLEYSFSKSLSGGEMLYGIPATIGGAVVMNAGAFMRSVSERIVEVESLVEGRILKKDGKDCGFGYRTSNFLNSNEIIISATFSFEERNKKDILEKAKSVLEVRRKIQPHGKSCGSVFKNPKEASAGQLIDGANLKGFQIGGAKVSEQHANFILTNNDAKASDVVELIDYIKQKVKNAFGIELKEEMEYVGEF